MVARTDDGRSVAFDTKDYRDLDHGYAATIHKAQGMTVDRAHMLATPGMDRHGAYVGMSRHRDGVALHYGRDDFKDDARLVHTLSRERPKDMASDYAKVDPVQTFAERRGITASGWRRSSGPSWIRHGGSSMAYASRFLQRSARHRSRPPSDAVCSTASTRACDRARPVPARPGARAAA